MAGSLPSKTVKKYLCWKLLTSMMDENAKAGWRVAKAAGGFGRREALDDIGAESLVEAVRGIGWLQEVAVEVR